MVTDIMSAYADRIVTAAAAVNWSNLELTFFSGPGARHHFLSWPRWRRGDPVHRMSNCFIS